MIKESHPIDDFFRESLKDLKVAPSESARSRFLEEATRIKGINGFKFWRLIYIVAFSVLITAAVFLYFYLFAPEKTNLSTNHAAIVNSIQHPYQPFTNNTVAKTNISIANLPLPSKNATLKTIQNKSTFPISRPDQVSINNPVFVDSSRPAGKSAPDQELFASKATNLTQPQLSNPETKPVDTQDKTVMTQGEISDVANRVAIAELADTSRFSSEMKAKEQPATAPLEPAVASASGKPFIPENVPSSKWMFSSYIKYSFDWTIENKVGKATNSLGLDGELKYGRFSLTMGAAISTLNRTNNYKVLYNRYQGNFKKLDSISFAWDNNHYYLVPSYFMTENKVWDSTIMSDNFQVLKKYRLIRIPLMIGYNYIERERFQLGIKTGIAMTFNLDARQVSEDYSSGQNKILGITQENFNYTGNNYYYLADIAASFYLTRRLVLDVEPHLNFLLNPSRGTASGNNSQLEPGIRMSLKYKL